MHRTVDVEDTIVAVSTPAGEGGIGIVRLSGASALKIADRIFVSKDGKKPSEFRTYTTHYGHVVDRVQGTRLRQGYGGQAGYREKRKRTTSDACPTKPIFR